MEIITKQYFPNACIICRKTANLKRCSRCNMISYCNSLHQKEHWPEHKDVCGIISTMMKERGVSHLFENLRGVDLDTWLNERMKMMKEAETRVRGSFEINDVLLFKHPRSCFVCHESRQTLLKNCPGCPGASFCQEHANSPIHDEDCANIHELFESGTRTMNCGIVEVHMQLTAIQRGIEFFKTSEQPTSMTEFIGNFAKSNRSSTIFKDWKLYLSEFFSTILTVFSALQKLECSSVSTLTIHVHNTIDSGTTGEALLHLFPKLKDLKLLVIDPLAPTNDNYTQQSLCPNCTQKGKKLSIYILSHSYGEYLVRNYAEMDLLVYSNVVASDSDDFSEVPMAANLLMMWSRLSCPLIVTTFTEREHNEFKKTIKSIFGNIAFYDGYFAHSF